MPRQAALRVRALDWMDSAPDEASPAVPTLLWQDSLPKVHQPLVVAEDVLALRLSHHLHRLV